jgi:hypothetical protein
MKRLRALFLLLCRRNCRQTKRRPQAPFCYGQKPYEFGEQHQVIPMLPLCRLHPASSAAVGSMTASGNRRLAAITRVPRHAIGGGCAGLCSVLWF